ncbi:hypothetical protein AGMMS50289_15750 [Betaproteobacteria bacterium]|nr:hypothetical protein AGMMS50289_15750 [Betaproteobacteria bacterium]
MQVGRNLAAINRWRIKSQIQPDGTPFAPRKIRERSGIRDRFQIKNVFAAMEAHGNSAGISKLADRLKNYHAMHGRKNLRDKISGGGSIRKKLKHKAMFTKLRSIQNLKARLIEGGVQVGFGKGGLVAAIHHLGLNKKIPARELLGITPADEQMIENLIYEQFHKLLDG